MNRFLAILVIGTFVIVSCEKEGGNVTLISKNNSSISHNTGKNCMDCHKSGGGGAGWFVVAGSAYDSTQINTYPNSTIQLTTMPNNTGNIASTIEIDSRGNFYSTENIDFGGGLYVSVLGKNGAQQNMNAKITEGACNMCHGNSTNKIWIK